MATLTLGGITSREAYTHRVYAKTAWADEWVLKEHVFVNRCQWSAAPSLGSADLYYRYGPAVIPGIDGVNYLEKFTLPTLAFVKIEFDVIDSADPETTTILKWYGIVGTIVDSMGGSQVRVYDSDLDDHVYVAQGVQELKAVAIEWLLDREYVDSSYFFKDSGVHTCKFAPDFNLPMPNRSENKHSVNGQQCYIFGGTDSWKLPDIVEYLLITQCPRSIDGMPIIKWDLEDATILPDWELPKISQQGYRLYPLLNQLIPRQRCLGFWFEMDATEETIHLKPFTFTESAIEVTGTSNSIPANANQNDVDLTGDLTASGVVAVTDGFSKYDQVRVVGQRARHIFSVDIFNGGLTRNWTPDWEDAYKEGDSTAFNYPAEDEVADRQRRDAIARAKLVETPPLYVFRRLRLAEDWDGLTRTDEPVFVTSIPDELGARSFFSAALTWAPLPGNANEYYADVDSFPASVIQEDHPFVMFLFSPRLGTWTSAESARIVSNLEGDDIEEHNNLFSVEIRPVRDDLAIDLFVHGQPQHVIDGYNYMSGHPLAHEPNIGTQFSLEKSVFTVAVWADYYCEARHPKSTYFVLDSDMLARVREIYVGQKYLLDALVKGTVVGVEPDGELITYTDDTFYLNDDRDTLQKIAAMAFGWYGKDRRAVGFQTGYVSDVIGLGMMITNLIDSTAGNTETNTVVTSYQISQSVGSTDSGQVARIEYKTEHSDFDVISFIGV